MGGIDDLPEASTVTASTFESDSIRVVTGNSDRILAGHVDDPMLGDMTTTGYLDFSTASDIPGEFRTGPVTSVQLRLVPDYTYGSTTGTTAFHLNEMPSEFTSNGARADTTLPAGATVTDFSISPTDTLVVIDLPAAWVSANDATLRGTSFGTDFHGFQIQPAGGQTVFGFDLARTVLRVVSNGETVNYPVSQRLWTASRSGTLALPPNELLVQDGFGNGVSFDFTFRQDSSLVGGAVNRAIIALYADTLSLQQNAPANFTRPVLQGVILAALIDTSAVALGQFSLRDGKFVMTSGDIINIVQRRLSGVETADRFRVTPIVNNTINPLLLYTPSAPDKAPKAVVTVSPTGE
ncbi:MAG TPA: hypothetical protein VFG50_02965 [Rhodothermales bacterium]|nr:hypothetical protein [Rhodothermales bacterium]